eukprot:12674792-Alexandrium_andersonii.AAC.1
MLVSRCSKRGDHGRSGRRPRRRRSPGRPWPPPTCAPSLSPRPPEGQPAGVLSAGRAGHDGGRTNVAG